MLENLDLSTIITLVLAGVTTFAGAFWALTKDKLSKIVKLVREILEVADNLEKALSDDKISKEEIKTIKKELSDVKVAWSKLWKKK